MLKLIGYIIFQSAFLTAAQVFLKLTMLKTPKFSFTFIYFKDLLTNWHFATSGICMLAAGLIWFYILKHFDLSVAYPATAIAYIFGMLAAIFIFHEAVPVTRWIGVALIITGVFFIVK
jgi:undecaprenyl phosphate-alpha-L-ara4N flippase subunit ArnE